MDLLKSNQISSRCHCGGFHADCDQPAHATLISNEDEQRAMGNVLADGLLAGMFPQQRKRRAFLKAVGRNTALAALSTLTPLSIQHLK